MADPKLFVPPVMYYLKYCKLSCPFLSDKISFCTLFDAKLNKVFKYSFARCVRCNRAFK